MTAKKHRMTVPEAICGWLSLGLIYLLEQFFSKKWIVGRTVSEQYGLSGEEKNAYLSLEVSESWSSKAQAGA